MNDKKIIRGIILFILVVTPLLFFTDLTRNPYHTQITLLNISLELAVGMISLFALLRKGFSWKKTPIDTPLLLFLVIATASILWAWISHPVFRFPIYSESVKRWLYLVINCYAAFYIAVLYVDRENRRRYIDISLAVGIIAAGYGVLQYFGIELVWPKILNPFGGRSVSTFGNPNFLSSYLVLLLPLCVHYLFDSAQGWRLKSGDVLTLSLLGLFMIYLGLTYGRRDHSVDAVIGSCIGCGVILAAWKLRLGKIWYLLGSFLFTAALLCTLTRSSWLGMFAAGGIYTAGLIKAKKLDLRVFAVLSVLIFGTVYFWPPSRVSGYAPSIKERLVEIKTVTETTYQPVHQRLLIWRCTLSMIQQFPVLGVGWGNIELFYPYYQGPHMIGNFFRKYRTHANNAHNEVLEILSQVGIAGFGIYILILATAFFALWKNRKFLFYENGLLPLALAAAAAGMLVDNLLNVSLHFAVPGFQYWWQMGLLMGMLAIENKNIPLAAVPRRVVVWGIVVWSMLLILRSVFLQISEVSFFKGFKLSKSNNLTQAIPALEKARRFHRLEVNNNYELGNCYARLKDRKKALFAYEEALRSNAGYDEIFFNTAAIYLQMTEQAKKREPENVAVYKERARQNYEIALRINPLTLDSYLALGNIYLEDLNRFSGEVIALYDQALLFYPDHKDIWNNLGYVHTRMKDHQKAVDCYARALAIDPAFNLARTNLHVALNAMGKTTHPILEKEAKLQEIDGMVRKQEYDKALIKTQALFEEFPGDVRIQIYRGNIYFSQNRFEDAARSFLSILKDNPRNVTALNNLGSTYIRMGNFPEAYRQFETVLSIESDNKIAQENIAILKKAQAGG